MFTPVRLGPLRLRNRFVRTATFEGMSPNGAPTEALIEHHRQVARGGVGLDTVAYCSVSNDGRSYATQLWMRPEIVPGLRRLTDAVHGEGAAVSLQLGHCGYFSNRRVIGGAPLGPSRLLCTYGLSLSRAMSEADLERVIADFGRAAALAREAGFDALELHAGHGYLLSQFLSPYTNRRADHWGGLLERRARLTLEVVRAVRAAVGERMALLVKVNLRDGFAGGLELDEAIDVMRLIEREAVDALVLSGGFVSRTPFYMLRGELPVREMAAAQPAWLTRVGMTLFGRLLVPAHPFAEAFFLDEARQVRTAVRLPLVLVGGLRSRAAIAAALAEGFDLVALGRPLIHDPDFVRKLERGELERSGCEPCNVCVAEMDRGGVRCPRADYKQKPSA